MADLQKIYRQFSDTLPELARIMADDLERFETNRRDLLVDYTRTFQKLVEILMTLPYEAKEEAIKAIKDYIASRQQPYGQWEDPGWLAYILGQIVEKTKKPKPEEPLTDDELPF